MRELYADFNDFAANGTLPLTCSGSIESIRRLAEPLQEGEEVWLTDGEIRTRAWVHQYSDGSWEARSSWDFQPNL